MQEARSLASVIGEDELSEMDQKYLAFGKLFEQIFIGQGYKRRSIEQTLNLGWALLSTLPESALDRLDPQLIKENYNPAQASKIIDLEQSEGE